MNVQQFGLAGYQLRLPMYEGPLDVLLQLIERDRLEVSNVSLVAITDGFLGYIAALRDPDPALLAQFLAVASRLLVLKSRALLPRPADEPEDDQADDLVRQLREYQQAKLAAAMFRERESAGLRSFPRPPSRANGSANLVLVVPPPSHLRRALLRAVARRRQEPEVTRLRVQVTIEEMVARIRRELEGLRVVSFRRIVGGATREELVAGFIALLALWRRGVVAVEQRQHFDDIWIERIPSGGSG